MSKPQDTFKYKPYTGPAAGWGALICLSQYWIDSKQPFKNLKAMLKTNQNGGFDCPGCAWGESPSDGPIRFCENGAKAVNWEATSRKVGKAFFAQYSVSQLREQSDYWLEYQGRLTEPMRYNAKTDHYVPISWADAFQLVATHLKKLQNPNEVAFYTSGRASNESAYLYQLFARALGTNNMPDCSNMCHEATSVGVPPSIGVAKGTVTIKDFEKTDAIFSFGHNPGTNHPRMLSYLADAVKRGVQVVCFNPLKERGLEKFQAPQNPIQMGTDTSTPTHTAFYQPALGGDFAIMRGMAKMLWAWEQECRSQGKSSVFDQDFISTHTHGIEEYLAAVDATPWSMILEQSGLTKGQIEEAAGIYRDAKTSIVCWSMGITQNQHSVATIHEIINLQLLKGQIGKPGGGISPMRGHSNVQGNRTMGIWERPSKKFLDGLEKRFSFSVPRENGYNVVEAIQAMLEGKVKVFIGLGGNFAQATPDTPRTHQGLRQCALTVQITTKLNRTHITHGQDALILPCLGRTEIDRQATGPQAITVEDTFSMVHASHGQLHPMSDLMRSEVFIVAGMAKATLGDHPIAWDQMVADYSKIRGLIQESIAGFENFEERLKHPGGFHLYNSARERKWDTPTGKAAFVVNPLPDNLLHEALHDIQEKPELILQTLRSHDQFNTTLYSLNDRYRGIKNQRNVLFVNPDEIKRLGYQAGQLVDITSIWNDGIERVVKSFQLYPYDIPNGQAAAYYPETNPLVPLGSFGKGSFTPTSKFIGIKLNASEESETLVKAY